MKNFSFNKDINMIRELLNMSQEEFSREIGVTQISISNYESGAEIPSPNILEKIYQYAFKNKIDINKIKSEFFIDDKKKQILLFHGSRYGVDFPISLDKSSPFSDFGRGFYLGENLRQSACWISDSIKGSVYCFYAKIDDLKVVKFDVDLNWIIAVCINRGYLKDKMHLKIVKDVYELIKSADVIIAPIADNIMYLTIQEFAEGFITDEQCCHALSAANRLGVQYVFRSEKAIDRLKCINRLYLSKAEKEYYSTIKIEDQKIGQEKVIIARRIYRGQGVYIGEIE